MVAVVCAFLMSLWVGSACAAGEDLKMSLDLTDGCHVVGKPSFHAIHVRTSFAEMDIPIEQVVEMRLTDDRKSATLLLRNGDRLSAAPSLPKVEMTTLFGDVAIDIKLVERIRVLVGPAQAKATER